MEWQGTGSILAQQVESQRRRVLAVYQSDRKRVDEDANNEQTIVEGAYRNRQIYELVQNAVDAVGRDGRIEIVLDGDSLYVANSGAPFSSKGIDAILASHLSGKRGEEIGRFGLGFKSLLAVSASPVVLSRSVSFRFDPRESRREIESVIGSTLRSPRMRIAYAVDPHQVASNNPTLSRLMDWAATVVIAPLDSGVDSVRAQVAGFPSQFLLFSSSVASFATQVDDERKEFAVIREGDQATITSEAGSETWQVFQRVHRPSAKARADVGEISEREQVRISWAVPKAGRQAVGRLWAFFPTEDEMTLSGIVNAPWRLSEDRTRVLAGAFNEELLTEVLPELVASSMQGIFSASKPGFHIDLLPARGREARSWADDILNQPVMAALARAFAVPDLNGSLRRAKDLKVVPALKSGRRDELFHDWMGHVSDRASWAHPDVSATDARRAKVERLASRGAVPVRTWLEAAVDGEDLDSVGFGIVALAELLASGDVARDELSEFKALPSVDGPLLKVQPERVFLPGDGGEASVATINAEVLDRPGVAGALERLGIRVHDAARQLRDQALAARDGRQWALVWEVARSLPAADAATALRQAISAGRQLTVRNAEGKWVEAGEVFLPGVMLGQEPSGADRRHCLDVSWHESDLNILSRLGMSEAPTPDSIHVAPWLERWKRHIRDQLQGEVTVTDQGISDIVAEHESFWPLPQSPKLSDEALHRVSRRLASHGALKPWVTRIGTLESPYAWWVRHYGRIQTTWGLLPVQLAMWPDEEEWAPGFPVAQEASIQAGMFEQVVTTPHDYTVDDWTELFARARQLDEEARAWFYSWAGFLRREGLGVPEPKQLMARLNSGPQLFKTAEILAVADEEMAVELQAANFPIIVAPNEDEVVNLILGLGLGDAREQLDRVELALPSGDPLPLLDVFSKLREWDLDGDEGFDELNLQLCESLDVEYTTVAGSRLSPRSHRRDDNLIQVTGRSDVEQLQQVSAVLGLSLDDEDIDSIIREKRKPTRPGADELRGLPNDAARFARLVPPEVLRKQLPKEALEILEEEAELTPQRLAELALVARGPELLKRKAVRDAFLEHGLEVPKLNGGGPAIAFLEDLGLDEVFASVDRPLKRPPAEEYVPGRVELGDLHDYQEECVQAIVDVLEAVRGHRRRGMLSLPTGAGKTRVAVESLIRAADSGALKRRAAWIAHSDELCEQAAQTILEVWQARSPRRALQLSRFWGAYDISESDPGAFHVVVATYQKLANAVGSKDWLVQPDVIYVDEAHGAITPSYTKIMQWLGGVSQVSQMEVPLIGLSATPFRGTSEEETSRLVARFGARRFDEDAFPDDENRYRDLQERGILAKVRQREILGSEIELTEMELKELEDRKWLPTTAGKKLGDDRARTLRILDAVMGLPSDWPVLLFAPSIESAKVLATLLSVRDRPARAILGETAAVERHRAIADFKAGRVKVLTNFGVLTQGFDAPMVKAVVVARPTLSLKLYQQMIGRGLRGPRNRGSDEVLILNVADNLKNHGVEPFAFREFEQLWRVDDES